MNNIKKKKGWRNLSFDCMRSNVGKLISLIFIISWVIIGNYVLLNLFLAILLDGFNHTQAINEELEDFPDLKENYFSKIQLESLKNIEQIECKSSLFIFNLDKSFIRKIFRKIVKHSYFEITILIFIFLSSLNLVFDTYIDPISNDPYEIKKRNISNILNIFFNSIFLSESVLKIISYGFIYCPDSYLRDYWNVIDFLIVLISVIDMSLLNLNLTQFRVEKKNILKY